LELHKVTQFLAELEQSRPLSKFGEAVWYATVEKVTIILEGKIVFKLRDGSTAEHQ